MSANVSVANPANPSPNFPSSLSMIRSPSIFQCEEIKVIHMAQGTRTATCDSITGANVIHFGDTFFSGRFPNIDLNEVEMCEVISAMSRTR